MTIKCRNTRQGCEIPTHHVHINIIKKFVAYLRNYLFLWLEIPNAIKIHNYSLITYNLLNLTSKDISTI